MSNKCRNLGLGRKMMGGSERMRVLLFARCRVYRPRFKWKVESDLVSSNVVTGASYFPDLQFLVAEKRRFLPQKVLK